jgi:ribosomal protein S18 acetylase RimI-like enzyme
LGVPERHPAKPRSRKAAADGSAVSPDKLKRERAGTYRTVDGRFTVEQSSSGWLLLDAEQTDELGLPLARGPFGTLDEAREAITGARSGPRPTSALAGRSSVATSRPAGRKAKGAAARRDVASADPGDDAPDTGAAIAATPKPWLRALAKPSASGRSGPAVVIREIRTIDGDGLRELWREVGFHSIGDDDRSLARLARRNPGLVLVAAEGSRIVGSALGGWDGRRGWMYHVATAETHRRQGIASRLVTQIETGLHDLDCPKISVMVGEDNAGARAFWAARGYSIAPTRQLSRMVETD